MALTALTCSKPVLGFRPTKTSHREPANPARPQRAAISFPSTRPVSTQFVLMVDLTSPEGRTWWAVGAGDTLAEADTFAQDSCPTDTTWQPTRWDDLYGD